MRKQNKNGDTISIWIVEDNQHFRKTLLNLLNHSSGLHCEQTFNSCEDTIEKLKIAEPPEVILLDIGLKGMSGIEGVKEFKMRSPATSILMLTIHEDSKTVFEAICAGASGYLLKDSSPDRIIEAIKEVFDGGAPMTPQIARRVLEMFAQRESPKGEYGLTDREKEILRLLVDGSTKKIIAERLFLSFHTVNTHIKNIYSKMQVHTRSAIVSKVYQEKLL